jgi:hypothetical protein
VFGLLAVLGGELIAAVGGFPMFCAQGAILLRRTTLQVGLRQIRFGFGCEGITVVVQ